MSRLRVSKRIERDLNHDFGELLHRYAVEQRLTPEQVAGELGCSMQALMREAKAAGYRIVRRLEPDPSK